MVAGGALNFFGITGGGGQKKAVKVPAKSKPDSTGGQQVVPCISLEPQYPAPHMASANMYALHENVEGEKEEAAAEDLDDIKTMVRNIDNNNGGGAEALAEEAAACLDSLDLDTKSVRLNLNMDSLKFMLKCVGCGRFLFPPILQCVSGHMQCKSCFDVKPQCAMCRQKLVDVPAKFAEMITEQFKIQCAYTDKGCQETVPFKVGV